MWKIVEKKVEKKVKKIVEKKADVNGPLHKLQTVNDECEEIQNGFMVHSDRLFLSTIFATIVIAIAIAIANRKKMGTHK